MEKLEKAKKGGDQEQVQCISSRQTAISTLLDITKQSQIKMENSIASRNDLRADSEFQRISVALSKAKQFSTEVDNCLKSLANKEQTGQETTVNVDSSAVTELLVGEEASFELDNASNSVENLNSEVTTDSNSSETSSESIAPPTNTSPYE
jgi:hypothetical protein